MMMNETLLTASESSPCRLAVVVPCYRVAGQVADVLAAIGPEVWRIYCVDDACPQRSGRAVEEQAARDPRIRCLTHARNMGVGAAVVTGYKQAIHDGAEVIVKLDGDGQMDPARIADLAEPIRSGEADYVKGNRFFDLEGLRAMPVRRLVGNAGLSFLSKLSTGYWTLFDPTNGYTAIHAAVARRLPLDKLSRRYFFESDILFRLNAMRAVVAEVPMDARYGDEPSSLSLAKSLLQFPWFHARNLGKRILYNYFLRGFSMASINLVAGLALLVLGVVFGAVQWIRGAESNLLASSGTVMLAALPVILGCQLLLSFIAFDMANVPRAAIHPRLHGYPRHAGKGVRNRSERYRREDDGVEKNGS
jgi:dolichol-phosphate mannosyltransferase